MASSEINLDGSEVSVIKAIGLSGGGIDGKSLLGKLPDLVPAELIDTLKGLVSIGYVESDRHSWKDKEDLERAHFHVNSGYMRDLKEALNPQPQAPKSRRVRRE
ncbi:MAG: hypothetical protein ABI680_16515 [Chthoniobacteraceae bacterium]